MRDLIIFISIALVYSITNAQSNYEQNMQNALKLWETNNRTQAISNFETIAQSEKDQWLPYYYAAQIKIVNSFQEQDEKKFNQLITGAQTDLDYATEISENNPEIMVLQALLHTARIAHDGQNAPLLSEPVERLYHAAKLIAPDNPRVVFCKAEWDMHVAMYFGEDSKSYCADLEHALELFAKFKPESSLHPNWGEARARQLLTNCKG